MVSPIPNNKECYRIPVRSKFYIVGPHKIQNELIASCLEQHIGNECCVRTHIRQIPKYKAKKRDRLELVILDCSRKELNAILKELKSCNILDQPRRRIVFFNVPSDIECKKNFVLRGIHGFFYKHDPLEIFLKGVQAILEGKLWLSREMMTKCIFEGTDRDESFKRGIGDLTDRQIEILALVAVGSTNEEIADKLCISHHTVKTHLYRIFKKLNVPNRVQASLWAAKNL